MTDKQLPPDWAIGRAAIELSGDGAEFFHERRYISVEKLTTRARELSAQQPDELPPGHIDQVVDFLKAAPVASEADEVPMIFDTQPDAARGGRPIKVLGQNGEPYPTTLVGATFEQPARDGVSDVVIGAAFLAVLRDPKIAWRETEAQPFIDRVAAEAARIASTQPPHPADGEAAAWISQHEADKVRAGQAWFLDASTKQGDGRTVPLYLHPTRGVEVADLLADFDAGKLRADAFVQAVRARAARSGVQR